MGCKKLLSMLSKQFTSLKRVLGDKGYRGKLQAWFFYITKGALLSISQNDKTNKGFQVHKWRWVIERSFAWLGNFRRLSNSLMDGGRIKIDKTNSLKLEFLIC